MAESPKRMREWHGELAEPHTSIFEEVQRGPMNDIWSKPQARFGLLIGAFLIGCALTGSLLTRPSFAEGKEREVSGTRISNADLVQRTQGLANLEEGFVAIADRVLPAVVSIRARRTIQVGSDVPDFDELFRGFGFQIPRRQLPRQFRTEGGGSGAIVRSDGWIITNDHVVGDADKVTVKLEDGREFDGTVRRDFRSDIAVVKIDATNLPTVDFADSSKVRVGQWAIAFGAPLSLEDTMTLGIISAKKRQQAIGMGDRGRFYPELLQTDASINPGNSGGPLVDVRGRVIGINVAIASPTGGNVGIGFAIPSNTARRTMEALITKGKVVRGFLGVIPVALTPAHREKYGVPRGGALIETVSGDTPASRAGLMPEDVVLKINGQPVEDDVDFRNKIADSAPGETVELLIKRAGKEMTIRAKLEEAPEVGGESGTRPEARGTRKLGIRVEALTPEARREYKLEDVREGVVVVEVEGGSPADDAGIQPGDVIVRADGRAVTSPNELADAVQKARSGSKMNLVIQRGKTRTLVSVEVP